MELMNKFSGADISLEDLIVLFCQERVARLARHDTLARMLHTHVLHFKEGQCEWLVHHTRQGVREAFPRRLREPVLHQDGALLRAPVNASSENNVAVGNERCAINLDLDTTPTFGPWFGHQRLRGSGDLCSAVHDVMPPVVCERASKAADRNRCEMVAR